MHARDDRRVGAQVQRARRSLGAELAHRGVVAHQHRAVELGSELDGGHDPHHRPPASGDVDQRARTVDAQLCAAAAPEDDRPGAGRRGVEEAPADHRAAQGLQQARVGRVDRDAAGLLRVDAVAAAHGRVQRAHRVDALDAAHAPQRLRGALGQRRVVAAERLPRRGGEQVRAQPIELLQQPRARGLREPEHGDHARDADGDPERRQDRPQAPRAQARRPRRAADRPGSSREVIAPPRRPSRSAMRRGRAAARSRSCVMIITVVPSPLSSRSSARTSAPERESRLPGRLVGEDDRRPGDDRAGDRHALALAARELLGAVVQACPSPTRSSAVAPRPCAARSRRAAVEQALRDVLQRGHPVDQEELLEHEADRGRAQPRELAVVEVGDVDAGHADAPARRAIERAHDVQQRRLARARRADDADELAILDLEADSVERPHASGVLLDDVLQREAHRGTTTRVPGARPEPVTCTQSSAKAPRVTPTSRRDPASSIA